MVISHVASGKNIGHEGGPNRERVILILRTNTNEIFMDNLREIVIEIISRESKSKMTYGTIRSSL